MMDRAKIFAEALFATDEGPPDPERIRWLMDDLRDFLGHAGGRARGIFRLCLFACDWLAPLSVRKVPTLANLSRDERIRALATLEHSALGPAALGPKAILCILWFEHPDTQRETRTTPSCMTEVRS